MVDLEAGVLLVAAAPLLDPHFVGTVVLVLDHNAEGALGVVLNRPVGDGVAHGAADPATPLFEGGPVEPAVRVVLGLTAGHPGSTRWRAAIGATADLAALLAEFDGARSRVFAGYAGWGVGQLEAEIAEGAWHVVPAEADDMVCDRPERLRREVLRRQPAPLSWQGLRPADPGWN